VPSAAACWSASLAERVDRGLVAERFAGQQRQVGVGPQLRQGARVAEGLGGAGEAVEVVVGLAGQVGRQVGPGQERGAVGERLQPHLPVGHPAQVLLPPLVRLGPGDVVAQLVPQLGHRPPWGPAQQQVGDRPGHLVVVDVGQGVDERVGLAVVDAAVPQCLPDVGQPAGQLPTQLELPVGVGGGQRKLPRDLLGRPVLLVAGAGQRPLRFVRGLPGLVQVGQELRVDIRQQPVPGGGEHAQVLTRQPVRSIVASTAHSSGPGGICANPSGNRCRSPPS
jgi:hypothetical protein